MPSHRNALRAGIFMLLSVAITVFIIIQIAGTGFLTTHYRQCQIIFSLGDDIGGLRKGDDVRLGGMSVGTVKGIHFVRAGSQGPGQPAADSIVVSADVPDEYPLAINAKVAIKTSLTGVTSMNISDLGSGPPLVEGQYLRGQPDPFTTLTKSLGAAGPKLVDDLDEARLTLQTFRAQGQTVGEDIHETINFDVRPRLRDVSNSAIGALDSIHELLGPSTKDFHESMADLRELADDLRRDGPSILAHVDDAVQKADVTMDDLRSTAGNLREFTGTARSIIVRNQSRLDEIIDGLKKTSDNLDQASVEIRSAPWRLIYKPSAGEMGNLNLYDAARQFAEGANDLDDAAASLRDTLKDKSADPAKVQKLYDALQDRFTHFQQVEDDLWKKVKE